MTIDRERPTTPASVETRTRRSRTLLNTICPSPIRVSPLTPRAALPAVASAAQSLTVWGRGYGRVNGIAPPLPRFVHCTISLDNLLCSAHIALARRATAQNAIRRRRCGAGRGYNDPDRHHSEVQQGQCRRRSEELRRRLQGRPGDRGRDRRLRQEVLRAVDRHAREARRRQDAR